MSASKIVRRIINTAAAGPASGPYSQAVQVDKTLYMSGCLGLDPTTGQFVGESVQEQARQSEMMTSFPNWAQVLTNLGEVLKAAGASYKNVVKTNVFLKDMNDFAAMNEIYTQFFTEKHPARSTVQVAGLPRDAKIEIEAIAVVGEIEDQ